jgi:hypothetical protein
MLGIVDTVLVAGLGVVLAGMGVVLQLILVLIEAQRTERATCHA